MPETRNMAFATRAVHAGERAPHDGVVPVVTPIHPAVGYTYPDMDHMDAVLGSEKSGYVYSARYANPTTHAFETAVASLEGGEAAIAFASGMAAIHAALLAAGVRAGAHVVAAMDVYGATYSMLHALFRELGVATTFVAVDDVAAVTAALESQPTALLYVETVSNPLLTVADLPQLAQLAHDHDALFLVDNTFATPYLCQPLALGADMVIHSATKFLSGHGDAMAGVVVSSHEWRAKLYEINKLVGGCLGPFEAWLALRGLKTLPLRLREQCRNAAALAAWLQAQPQIAHVYYPGLDAHPSRDVAQRVLADGNGGSMLAFELRDGTKERVFRFMEALSLIQPATTLGDLYTLILHPMTASHRGLTPEERAKVGIADGLLRLSAGIEATDDIKADLATALRQSEAS